MEPASTCAVAEIGSGVSKEGMAVPSSWVFRASPLVGRGVGEVVRIGAVLVGAAGWGGAGGSGAGGLADPARDALADGRGPLLRPRPGATVDGGRHGADQPGVDRQALAGRGLLGA